MTNDQILGLIVIVFVLIVLFNLKKSFQILISLVVLLVRIVTLIGGLIAFVYTESTPERVGIVFAGLFIFWLTDKLQDMFGDSDFFSGPSKQSPSRGGEVPTPKPPCLYCGGRGWVSCDRSHERDPNDPYKSCWKCHNSGRVTCPICHGRST